MVAPGPTRKPRISAAGKSAAVAAFMRNLDHPLKPAVAMVRATILSISPRIGEEIKWNSPSFYLIDHFATINIGRRTKARPTDHILVVLHQGARAKSTSAPGFDISDSHGLLQWLGKDRCAVTFHSLAEVKAHRTALKSIVRQWVAHL